MTVDVKHFEDCEQLFVSARKCFTVQALVQFFAIESKDGHPTKNRPPYHILDIGDNKKLYYNSVLDKFVDEYLIAPTPTAALESEDESDGPGEQDFLNRLFSGFVSALEETSFPGFCG